MFCQPTPKVVASSSGEAGLNAHVSAFCGEWVVSSGVEGMSVSSAATGIAFQVASGKLKHMQVKQMWTQHALVKSCRATFGRVSRLRH